MLDGILCERVVDMPGRSFCVWRLGLVLLLCAVLSSCGRQQAADGYDSCLMPQVQEYRALFVNGEKITQELSINRGSNPALIRNHSGFRPGVVPDGN